MKKIIAIISILIMFFSLFLGFIPRNVSAALQARSLAEPSLPIRNIPAVSGSTKLGSVPYNSIVDVLDTTIYKTQSGSSCGEGWLKIRYNGIVGYSCSESLSFYVSGELAVEREPINDYEIAWKEAGFPSSYWEGLTALKTLHPNYIFQAIQTNIDFTEAVANESVVGYSFIQITDLNSSKVAYISTAGGSYDYETKKYIVQEGSSWYAADSRVVAYYLDPRNFLTDNRVFMFEDLSYEGTYITEVAIQKVFNSFPNLYPYAKDFLDAGIQTKINPVYLAVLSRQEIGKGTMVISGNTYTYPIENNVYPSWRGKEISGVYNFFNYGAGTDRYPAYNSLIYAYNQGWNTPLLALVGGANKIGNGYIKKGQNTSYFKKFNVKPGAANGTYTHQFQTNVQAPSSEASTSYSTYKSIGALDSNSEVSFLFQIPVYKNMPVKTELPTEPLFISNYGSTTIDGLLANTTIKNDGLYLSGFNIGETIEQVKNSIKAGGETAEIITYNNAGSVKESGSLVTGDKIKITYEEESQMYEVVIYGDSSGDGLIDIMDLLKVQKHILESSLLQDSFYKAADNNKDGEVSIIDLLRVQKHILGQIKIVG